MRIIARIVLGNKRLFNSIAELFPNDTVGFEKLGIFAQCGSLLTKYSLDANDSNQNLADYLRNSLKLAAF